MAAEQSVVERLRFSKANPVKNFSIPHDDAMLLLAVVDAARPWGKFVIQHDGGKLDRALQALHTQASDEGKP